MIQRSKLRQKIKKLILSEILSLDNCLNKKGDKIFWREGNLSKELNIYFSRYSNESEFLFRIEWNIVLYTPGSILDKRRILKNSMKPLIGGDLSDLKKEKIIDFYELKLENSNFEDELNKIVEDIKINIQKYLIPFMKKLTSVNVILELFKNTKEKDFTWSYPASEGNKIIFASDLIMLLEGKDAALSYLKDNLSIIQHNEEIGIYTKKLTLENIEHEIKFLEKFDPKY